MTSKDMAEWRMHSLGLRGPLARPTDVVSHLAALQAQEFRYAKWSVAQRTTDVDETGMQLLLDEGAILRTHLLRPTWHFVSPEDIVWMLDLTAPRVHALNAYMYRQLDVNPEEVAESNRCLEKHLSGGTHLTRKEIAARLGEAGIDASGFRLAYFLMQAELNGLICSGARRGKQQTYALIAERAPQARRLDPDEGLVELTRRFFTSRAPATVTDYSRWSSLKMVDCRRALDMLGSEMESQKIDDRTYWFPAGSAVRSVATKVDLVQIYDESVMSYSESRDVLSGPASGSESNYMHAILLNGRLVGRWKSTERKNAIEIELSLDEPLDRTGNKELKRALERYVRFTGKPMTEI